MRICLKDLHFWDIFALAGVFAGQQAGAAREGYRTGADGGAGRY